MDTETTNSAAQAERSERESPDDARVSPEMLPSLFSAYLNELLFGAELAAIELKYKLYSLFFRIVLMVLFTIAAACAVILAVEALFAVGSTLVSDLLSIPMTEGRGLVGAATLLFTLLAIYFGKSAMENSMLKHGKETLQKHLHKTFH